MQSRFTKKAQEALDHASEAAVMLGHSYIGSEHLLIGLIQTKECLASAVLAEYDVSLAQAEADVVAFVQGLLGNKLLIQQPVQEIQP